MVHTHYTSLHLTLKKLLTKQKYRTMIWSEDIFNILIVFAASSIWNKNIHSYTTFYRIMDIKHC